MINVNQLLFAKTLFCDWPGIKWFAATFRYQVYSTPCFYYCNSLAVVMDSLRFKKYARNEAIANLVNFFSQTNTTWFTLFLYEQINKDSSKQNIFFKIQLKDYHITNFESSAIYIIENGLYCVSQYCRKKKFSIKHNYILQERTVQQRQVCKLINIYKLFQHTGRL